MKSNALEKTAASVKMIPEDAGKGTHYERCIKPFVGRSQAEYYQSQQDPERFRKSDDYLFKTGVSHIKKNEKDYLAEAQS